MRKDLILIYAIPFFIISILIEYILSKTLKKILFNKSDVIANLVLGAGHVVQGAIFSGLYWFSFSFLHAHRFFDLPESIYKFTSSHSLLPCIVLFVMTEDLCYYIFHRVSHESRIWWAAHETHHSSEDYNFSTALRQTWTGGFHGWIFWTPLPLLGFPVEWIFIQWSASLIYQFFLHTQLVKSIGVFELVLNSPSHHRVHHGTNTRYIDRNYGAIFIIWDRIFGTFEAESEKVRYGVTHPVNSFNPIYIAFHAWIDLYRDVKKAKSWRYRLGHIFLRPDWKSKE